MKECMCYTLVESQTPSPLVQTDFSVLVGITNIEKRGQTVFHWFDCCNNEKKFPAGHNSEICKGFTSEFNK